MFRGARLIISYYRDQESARQDELDECLRRNSENRYISEIICLIDNNIEPPVVVTKVQVDNRPTYNTLLSYSAPDRWNIIANSDIYFDDSLIELKERKGHEFLALARYDIIDGKAVLCNTADTQDAWMYYGAPRSMDANFAQGVPGCDNAFAYKAHEAGYKVVNPALSIKAYHLHNTGIRRYTYEQRIPEPYFTVWPSR